MRVLLTHPVERNRLLVADDLGFGYMATVLRKRGIEVKLGLGVMSVEDFKQLLRSYSPRMVGIKVFCTSAAGVNRTIDLVREVLPAATIIIGGPQVNASPDRILNYIRADLALHGDCERSFADYVEAIGAGQEVKDIPGLIFRSDGEVVVNPPDIIMDLDSLGIPAWDLMPPHSGGQLQLSRCSPTASVLTSRGCYGKCTFCSEANGKLRFRSPELVLEELLMLRDDYGVREIMFQDSNFLARRDRVETMCRMMLEKELKLPWSVPYGTRWETLDYDLLSLMKKAGCYRISVGVETGSPRWQKEIRKNIDLEKLRVKLRDCRRSGVEIMANFMLGFPGETREEMAMTRKLALELAIDYASFYVFTPYPGSALFDSLVEQGLVDPDDFQQFDKFDYDNQLSEASPRELFWKVRLNLLSFYGRPRGMLSLLKNLKYPHFFKVVCKLLYYEFIFSRHTQQHAY